MLSLNVDLFLECELSASTLRGWFNGFLDDTVGIGINWGAGFLVGLLPSFSSAMSALFPVCRNSVFSTSSTPTTHHFQRYNQVIGFFAAEYKAGLVVKELMTMESSAFC